jgi:hypothetical protein
MQNKILEQNGQSTEGIGLWVRGPISLRHVVVAVLRLLSNLTAAPTL